MPSKHIADHPAQFCRRDGLGENVDRAEFHRRHGVWDRAVRGDNNDRGLIRAHSQSS
jgi:hypothetical protein